MTNDETNARRTARSRLPNLLLFWSLEFRHSSFIRGFEFRASSFSVSIREVISKKFLSLFPAIIILALMAGGCSSHPPAMPASRPVVISICSPTWDDVLKSRVTPPAGWKPDPLKVTDKSRHRVWISPGGSTAYGVIYFDLPLPVGVDLAFSGFLSGMKKTSGEAILIFKSEDANGIHFVADGGLYRIRCNMTVSGFHGWVVYAGSLRAKPVNPEELKIAEQARDQSEAGPR